ncbi:MULTISPECIES: AraC family transcriptional regulator [unclassified Photobacterium]|uniref:AraC family transcriptional regulator n=1 Tax=unclassified Photobacterium TaxID=2628852 RepID=UPI000D178198|nr:MULTISPECIES: AraC family transcriptional regulator [unclassified Photobacterium]PSV26146.1 AraC family transcriptional regulator [Photobacterium sp. GB-56]PSV30817.1 AraC family transcriptional regulator [Photobacterium sp. GB-72]
MLDIAFIRTLFIKPLNSALIKHYDLSFSHLEVPDLLLKESMSLLPFNDYLAWLERIEQLTDDSAYMVKLAKEITFEQMGGLGEWYLSCPDLPLALRRINYGLSCLQSGASYHSELSGNILKWTYHNPYSKGRGGLHDNLRVAILFVQTIREYLGDDFTPLKIQLNTTETHNSAINDYFQCPIRWNAHSTQVWLPMSVLEHVDNRVLKFKKPMLMSNLQLDDFLNMPQPTDTAKLMFELINYSRYYQYPNLDFIAQRLDLSKQQLQRRLHRFGWTFTDTTNYVLCNIAIKYMQRGLPITEIAANLSYKNVQSFNKAFQRNRGVTPIQYQQRLLEKQKS